MATETPYYLVSVNKENEAFEVLRYLRRKTEEDIQDKLDAIKLHLERLQPGSYLDLKRKEPAKRFCIVWL